MSVIINIGMKR